MAGDPAQLLTTWEVASNAWNVVYGIGGFAVAVIMMAFSQGKAKGEAETALAARLSGMEKRLVDLETEQVSFQNEARADIEKLSMNHDKTRDQLSDIKATMAQKSDLRDVAAAVQASIGALTARVDQLLTHMHAK
jgi:uncharacterized coiled-coil protein SlyX